MLQQIKKLLSKAQRLQWYETYWIFDLHGTLIKPSHNHDLSQIEWYSYAKECLQILSKRDDIKLILWTSSYPHELVHFLNEFKSSDIRFSYINKNPEINSKHFGWYEEKFYFDLMFEDKAGFNPEEFKEILDFLKSEDFLKPDISWKK